MRALRLIPHFLDLPLRADEGGWHSGVVLEALMFSSPMAVAMNQHNVQMIECSQGDHTNF